MKELLRSQDHYLLPFDISPLIFKKLPHFWTQINQKLTINIIATFGGQKALTLSSIQTYPNYHITPIINSDFLRGKWGKSRILGEIIKYFVRLKSFRGRDSWSQQGDLNPRPG